METKTQVDAIPTELSKDDLLKYIELDLWGKFQERLWKVVGIALTIFTVVGLLGIPYYIKGEVSNTLQKQAADFKQRTEAILVYAKLIATLTVQYDSERYRFDADVYRLIDAIKKSREQRPASLYDRFNGIVVELTHLVSGKDFSGVVEAPAIMTRLRFDIPNDLKGKQWLPPTVHIVENKGFKASGSYTEVHPIRDGSYEGSIKDLRFRIVTLEALRRAIASSQEKLLTLGGATEMERRVETVRVKSLESTEFSDSLAKEVTALANNFLNDKEKREFARFQSLYLQGEAFKYQAPNPRSRGARGKAARAPHRER